MGWIELTDPFGTRTLIQVSHIDFAIDDGNSTAIGIGDKAETFEISFTDFKSLVEANHHVSSENI
ncbi:hypothetical protein [Levilactobacillus sp. N40-8-2]|uniref:hypothetical protein n=1 Tax=Levilactobacillus muriae TaxID=3238987 RepID=UPI0038B2CF3F